MPDLQDGSPGGGGQGGGGQEGGGHGGGGEAPEGGGGTFLSTCEREGEMVREALDSIGIYMYLICGTNKDRCSAKLCKHI